MAAKSLIGFRPGDSDLSNLAEVVEYMEYLNDVNGISLFSRVSDSDAIRFALKFTAQHVRSNAGDVGTR